MGRRYQGAAPGSALRFPGRLVTNSTATGEVQRRLAAGERDFQGASLSGVNLRGVNLIGTNLRG
ncbi:MAG TPA: pentapeptide repeat-containing protein, partial [Vicinamibacteria bacterium]|nr:pentapeptide repeat-containing protein [Vicinamibacteria bacterium]